jgi:hypothetical protein
MALIMSFYHEKSTHVHVRDFKSKGAPSRNQEECLDPLLLWQNKVRTFRTRDANLSIWREAAAIPLRQEHP